MILWINGAFGSGKTHAAYELKYRLHNSFVFDPEEAGFYIRENIPMALEVDDFQDHSLWRQFNLEMLEFIDSKYSGIVIVPMTITDEDYFNEIIGELKKRGHFVKHFTLTADRDTLVKRLQKRGDGATSWPALQIDRCMMAFQKTCFSEQIDTTNLSIDEVVETLASRCGLKLRPDHRNWLFKRADRVKIWMHHIRVL